MRKSFLGLNNLNLIKKFKISFSKLNLGEIHFSPRKIQIGVNSNGNS